MYMNSSALVAILRTSAKRTELCLSEHKNMHSRTKKALYINICAIVKRSNTYKISTTYRIYVFTNENISPSIVMNKEFLTQTVRDINTNIIDRDDNWNLLLKEKLIISSV